MVEYREAQHDLFRTVVFISAHAPALDHSRGECNFMHLHFVSRSGLASGHIDDLRCSGGMTLELPA
jgi:hypothetical protein